jgi:hypothetical protein
MIIVLTPTKSATSPSRLVSRKFRPRPHRNVKLVLESEILYRHLEVIIWRKVMKLYTRVILANDDVAQGDNGGQSGKVC